MRLRLFLFTVVLSLPFMRCGKTNLDVKLSNDDRPWRLKKYKVNGVDSTNFVNVGGFDNFFDYFLMGPMESRTQGTPLFYNDFYEFVPITDNHNKTFIVNRIDVVKKPTYMHKDTCSNMNIQDCQRNVFMPEGIETVWTIERLKAHNFILSCQQKNKYYIEMTD